MPIQLSLVLTPQQASDPGLYTPLVALRVGVSESRIASIRIVRRSIDARSREVKVNVGFEVYTDSEGPPDEVFFEYADVSGRTPVVIVGSGPAGLFAALRFIELGYKPIVLERGKDVSARKRDIAQINRNGEVNPDSNYSFGEGGAGTFSDGKLYTRSKKRGDFRKALEVFRFHGADESILYDAHPHIGTDRLPRIIQAIRQTITDAGGELLFDARVSGILVKDGVAKGVYVTASTPSESLRFQPRASRVSHQGFSGGSTGGGEPSRDIQPAAQLIEGAAVVLATGHSARDVYEALHNAGVELESKPFAMGVRVEHPQTLIDQIQYHRPERGEYLPAAAYSLTAQVGGRGVYSFCMCPGGFIVPAMTSPGEMVVNGMSPSGRNSVHANSGIVTEVREADFAHLLKEHGVLAGLRFQQELERKAYSTVSDRQVAPAQRLTDFTRGKLSRSLPATSYVPGLASTQMYDWMPRFMGDALRGGFTEFGKKMRGFLTDEAVLIGLESRTSSPVRIPRDRNTLMHIRVRGLFPSGEGAGYAGGIISAAVDGERSAEMAVKYIKGEIK